MSIEEHFANILESQPMITDEHIEKLEIAEDSVLLVRVPINMSRSEGTQILDQIRKIIHGKTGFDPGVLMVARDCDLAALDIESLNKLRAEIDATLQYHYSKHGGNTSN